MPRVTLASLLLILAGCGHEQASPAQRPARHAPEQSATNSVSTYELRLLDGDSLPQRMEDGGCERVTYSGTYELGRTSWTSTARIGGSCYGRDSLPHLSRYSGTYSSRGDTLTFVSQDSALGTLKMGRAVQHGDTLRAAGPGLFDGPTEIYLRRH